MKTAIASLFCVILASTTLSVAKAHEAQDPARLDKPVIENLMTQALEGAEGLEVILSHVAIPPNFELPSHWHPGEEFAYVLQGSVTVTLDGEGERKISEGGFGMIPLKRIHSAKAGDQGVTLLVFRVHEQGKPGRVLVEE